MCRERNMEKLRILILEDNPNDAELIQHELRRGGLSFAAEKVETRKDFQKALEEFKPDIILADYTLPQFDGLSALAISQERSPDMPVVFVTGTMGEEVAVNALKKGATDYVLKERLSRLVPAVTRALHESIAKTERKRAEELLRESEERYRTLIENAYDMVQSVAPDGRFKYVNSAWLKIMGYTWDELQHITIFDILHPSCIPHCTQDFQRVLSGESLNDVEAVFVAKDGRSIDVRGSVTPRIIGDKIIGSQGIFRDITERKRAEETIQKSEEKYRNIFENIQDVYYETSLDGTILEVSPSIESILKGQYSRDDLIGKSILDFYADKKARETLLRSIKEQGTVRDFEVVFRNRDDTLISCSVSAMFQYDAGGNPVKLVGSMRDITERKQAEQKLSENREQLKAILDNIPDIAWLKDKESRFIAVNKPFGEACGANPDALPGKTDLDIWTKELAERYRADDKEVMETRARKQVEEPLIDKDGNRTWIETIKTPIFNASGDVIGTTGIARDITERKRSEEALRLEKNFSDTIINSLPGVFYMFDVQGNFFRWNSKFVEISGYTADELARMHGPDFFEGEDKSLIARAMQQAFETGTAEAEAHLVTKSGTKIPYFFSGLQIEIEGVAYLIGLGIDITERKHIERELYNNYYTQSAISMMLSLSIEKITLEMFLQKVLNMLLSLPWLSLEARGSIHLVEDVPEVLVLKAHYNLPAQLIQSCTRVPFGKCLCGMAAQTGKILFADHIDERHEICREGMPPHGHYIVPILYMEKTLGIINLYLNERHSRNQREEEFLHAVADTLSGILVRKQAEIQLQESSRKLSTLINNLPGIVYRCADDPQWTMEYLSEGVLDLTGYPAEEFIGNRVRSFASIIDPEDHRKIAESVRKALHEKKPYTLEYRITTASGSQKWVWERGSGVFAGDVLQALEGIITDVTERKTMEDRIEYLAYYDSLTGLPNRNLFLDRLTQGIARAEYSKKLVAVLMIDIDRFKSINDTYGLDTGDAVLRETGIRFQESVREGDTVARLGNDDFGILLIDIAQPEDIILVIEKIMRNASHPILHNGNELVLTLSVGISVYPDDGEDASSLVTNADLAFVKAKQQGRKNYQFYTEGMDVKASEFVLMEKNLFSAMRNEEFILHYQPYWDISTKKIAGMEALLRWQSPESGLVSPGKFIPVLEDTRMIIEVGEWILRTAIGQVKEWQDRGRSIVPVSVNLSLIQFRQQDLSQMIEKIIRASGFYPSLLTLEITESAFMQDIEFTFSVLENLKRIGVSVSIDDFGTGYSSLAYLKRFPIDNLKIDMSFIREMTIDPDTASIVMAIISMAHTLQLKTIAEGIETEEQWKFLRLLRCDMGQGFYFSKPLPAEEAEKLLT